uniref:hypothetical protein n=1 Tax=Prevotella sp. TaxID=59823 RepID=UPI0040292C98
MGLEGHVGRPQTEEVVAVEHEADDVGSRNHPAVGSMPVRDRVGVIADGYLFIEVVQPPERGHLELADQVDDIIIAKR